jgi:hypothetical protein
MSVESSSRSGGWNNAREALTEIRASPGQLQTFVASLFDQLGSLTSELLARELARQRTQRRTDHEALQEQIDRLAAAVAQLADTAAEPQRPASQKSNARE